MIKKLIILLLIFLPVSLALEIDCHDDGSILIQGLTKAYDINAKEKGTDNPYIEVPGKWQNYKAGKKTYYDFFSDEAQFIVGKPTTFYIKIGEKSRKSAVCPTFKFSCKVLNSTIEACYKRNNSFFAKFLIYNIPLRDKKHFFRFGSPFSFKYAVYEPGGKAITHSPTEYSPEFKHINMTLKKLNAGNKYTLSTDGINKSIERFSIYYKCKASSFYDSTVCTNMPICSDDTDCMKDEICKNKICEKLDCDDCQFIENHNCVSYDCCENSGCENDEFCEEHTCKKLNCTENEAITDHSCDLLNCSSEQHTVNHTCVRLECAEYEYAADHKCELLKCDYDEFIDDHNCKKLKCKFYQRAFDHDCLNFMEYIFAER